MIPLDGEPELAAALEGWSIRLDERRWEILRAYARDVAAAALRANLTADAEPRKVLLRHLADGFAAARVLSALEPVPARLADLGAGAGFVGFAVKLALPDREVSLIEPLEKRFSFLNLAVLRSRLPGLKVARRPGGGRYDAVLARAVAPLAEALTLAAPITAPGGTVLIHQSGAPDPEIPALRRAMRQTGAVLECAVPYRLPGEDMDRYLALFRFPRH